MTVSVTFRFQHCSTHRNFATSNKTKLVFQITNLKMNFMKKIILSLAIVFGLGIVQMNAQRVSFGVKADANMSSFILSDLDWESKIGFGANLGGFSKIDISENFAIQPELLFHFKSSKVEGMEGMANDNFHYWGMEFPVYALSQWNTVDGGRFFAGVGPYIGLGLSAKMDRADFDLYEKIIDDESMFRRFDFGFGALFGFEFSNRIQINASYKLGVLNMMDAGRDDARILPHTFSLGVGYRF
jgi:hypothetical protein